MNQLTKTRRRPSTMLRSLQEEVNDLFGDFFGTMDEEAQDLSRIWSPRLDISETDNEYRVTMDLPGVSKKDVDISASNHRLTIRGERKMESKEKGETFLRVERSRGTFHRSIPLPEGAQPEKAEAEFDAGMLTVHIPKSKEHVPTKISIM